MRIFKKKQFNLLAVTITTLLLALTCGLTACGSKSSDPAVPVRKTAAQKTAAWGRQLKRDPSAFPSIRNWKRRRWKRARSSRWKMRRQS